jgi:acetolactate synthase regulatory subunit
MSEATNFLAGVINPNELYTLKAFKKRLEVSDATLRAARRAGLRVRYLHKQGYIHGKDWIEYVVNSDRSSAENATPDTN